MRAVWRAGCVALITGFGGSGAIAAEQAPAHCALLGQVATSAFLGFVDALSSDDPEQVSRAAALLESTTASYGALDCDVAALGQTIDCVLTAPVDAGRRAAARSCLASQGLAQGQ